MSTENITTDRPQIPVSGLKRPEKTEGGIRFRIDSEFKPSGDQPQAIDALVEGIENGLSDQVLLGVTGSGKTFTMAQIIEQTQRPALIMAHNRPSPPSCTAR